MLVLSRKIGQQIVMPETGVNIVVLEVKGSRVRLGIDAPLAARIHRAEVWEQILAGTNRCNESAGEPNGRPLGSESSPEIRRALVGSMVFSGGDKDDSSTE